MIIDVLTIFPDMFENVMGLSILGRCQREGIFDFTAYDLRTWTHDVHRSVDDEPYGGGHGMLMTCPPVFEALDELKSHDDKPAPFTVFFTPSGKPFTQRVARELSEKERLLFVCGRYEGFDERVYSQADLCISLGDYVLTGGELAAMVVTDAVVRLLPGALGNSESSVDESFSDAHLLEYAQYTRPASYRGMNVPEVLLSGNHGLIEAWRKENAYERTARLRPDLIEKHRENNKDR